MQKAKYTAEFKEEAVRQVIDRGHSVVDVAKRLGIGDGNRTAGPGDAVLITTTDRYKSQSVKFIIQSF